MLLSTDAVGAAMVNRHVLYCCPGQANKKLEKQKKQKTEKQYGHLAPHTEHLHALLNKWLASDELWDTEGCIL